jgi:hypothetical protein
MVGAAALSEGVLERWKAIGGSLVEEKSKKGKKSEVKQLLLSPDGA